jgi:hypothetical protein
MPLAIQSQKSAGVALVDTDVSQALAALDHAKIRVLACGRIKGGTDYLVLADDADTQAAIEAIGRLWIGASAFRRRLKPAG